MGTLLRSVANRRRHRCSTAANGPNRRRAPSRSARSSAGCSPPAAGVASRTACGWNGPGWTRPGMYIGDTGPKGLHHLVYELIYNSVDEALAGFAKHIHVTVHVDGSISVADDGRGIPVNPYEDTGRSTLEMVLTEVGAGG